MLTLHEAICTVLSDSDRPLSAKEIASKVNERKLYIRQDNQPVPSSQIKLRIKNQASLFKVANGMISLSQKKVYRATPESLSGVLYRMFNRLTGKISNNASLKLILLLLLLKKTDQSRPQKFTYTQFLDRLNLLQEINPAIKEIIATLPELRAHFTDQDFTQLVAETNKIDFRKQANSDGIVNNSIDMIIQNSSFSSAVKSTPMYLREILVRLLDPRPGQKIYNPISKYGNLLLAIQQLYEVDKHKIELYADELDPETYEISVLRMMLMGVKNVHIENFDSLLAKRPIRMQAAFADLPLGVSNKEFSEDSWPAEFAFVEHMLRAVDDEGRIIVTVTNNALFGGGNIQQVREDLIDWDLVEAVISIPYKVKFTTLPQINILIINKNKAASKKGKVYFMDGGRLDPSDDQKLVQKILSSFADLSEEEKLSKIVTDEEIKENDCLLIPQRYVLQSDLKESRKNYLPLKQVISEYVEGTPLKSIELTSSRNNQPYVQTKNLSLSHSDWDLKIEKVDKYLQPEIAIKNARIIDKKAVLVSLTGNNLKPTWFDIPGQEIALGKHVVAFYITEEKVSADFLIEQLKSDEVQKQLEILSSSDEIPLIRLKDLLDLKVYLPSLDIQKEFLNSIKAFLIKQSEIEQQYEIQRSKTEETEQSIISTIKHNVLQQLATLTNDLGSLKDFLHRKESDKELLSFSEPIAPLFAGEDPDSVDSLDVVIERLFRNLNTAKQTLTKTEHILKHSKANTKARKTLLKAFIEEDIGNLYSDNNNFEIVVEGREIAVELDRFSIIAAFQNLIENALKHGFTDPEKKYKIVFKISKYSLMDNEFVQIQYMNDGNPLPDDFDFDDFISMGKTSGKNKGTGIGGYFVNKVIQNHNGILSIIPNEDLILSPYNVKFEILLLL